MTTNRPNAADKLREALRIIHGLTAGTGCTWLVGGSTGLMLQGVSLAALPRDLDLYADRTDALDIHCKLSAYAVDGQSENAGGLYRSLLSHYEIAGVPVELVGGFEVFAQDSEYKVEARDWAASWAERHDPDGAVDAGSGGASLLLMPLAHELLFNVMRERADRYEAIAAHCRSVNPRRHQLALKSLLERQQISLPLRRRLERLLSCSGSE